jgi:hypothetical protein
LTPTRLLLGIPDLPSSQVIFAPRGGGKSAQRRMIEYNAASAEVFAITYDRFEKIGVDNLEELSIDYHLRNIIEIGLLGFLLEYHERGMQAPSFSHRSRVGCHVFIGFLKHILTYINPNGDHSCALRRQNKMNSGSYSMAR